jgi:hypothetical protein
MAEKIFGINASIAKVGEANHGKSEGGDLRSVSSDDFLVGSFEQELGYIDFGGFADFIDQFPMTRISPRKACATREGALAGEESD